MESKTIPFWKVINAVADYGHLFQDSHMQHIYLILLRFANNNKIVNPSMQTIAKITCLSVWTIKTRIQKMEREGLISKVSGKEKGTSNSYKINNFFDWKNKADKESETEHMKRVVVTQPSSETPTGLVCDTKGIGVRHQGGRCETPRGWVSDTQGVGVRHQGGGCETPTKKNNIKRTNEKEHIKKKNSKSVLTSLEEKANEILKYLNDKSSKKYQLIQTNRKYILSRLKDKEKNYSLDDFKRVIDIKVSEWLDNEKMNQYLRPKTLFSKENFESYVQQKPVKESNEARKKWRREEKQTVYPDNQEDSGLSEEEIKKLLNKLKEV